ncbi:hypothetical protein G3580_06335 [Nitrogeniibacter mangrovi]|uniref:PilZ domain-containing protein n=1 Tax=Nitrogeniibacter mangrovi TaxID=2016596 RepID=A0A6C1B104_9RHOO|nr:hypothetical protein [Nitrogeniibacter mangrovi]QID17296.1 hypothetical protein G3580_06335 [Nitrogeniibacter mangrovi]
MLDAGPAARAIAWLAGEPSTDPAADLPEMLRQIETLMGADEVGPLQLHRALELFRLRVHDVQEVVVPRLTARALPLPSDLFNAVSALERITTAMASGFARVLADPGGGVITQRRKPEVLATLALELLTDALWLAGLKGSAPRAGLWHEAHRVFHMASVAAGSPKLPAELPRGPVQGAYKRLLALAAAQPESLTARELEWTVRYLEQCAWRAELSMHAKAGIETWDYWIDPAQDAGPIAMVRRSPPPVDGMIYFSAAELARGATGHLERIDKATDAGGDVIPGANLPELPVGLPAGDITKLLRTLRERWAMPPRREHMRRRNQYDVEVCIGLRSIWRLKHAGEEAAKILHWRVVNESPGGYAIMCVEANPDLLAAGMVVALRSQVGAHWSVCVVRWIRSDAPSQVEVGLQTISNESTPIRVGFRGGDDPGEMMPALVLPPIPGVRNHQAILAPSGAYRSRRFILIHESERIYVAQGRLLSLDMQTAHVELFQFEYDPYPL